MPFSASSDQKGQEGCGGGWGAKTQNSSLGH